MNSFACPHQFALDQAHAEPRFLNPCSENQHFCFVDWCTVNILDRKVVFLSAQKASHFIRKRRATRTH